MMRLQSFIVTLTLAVCLGVGFFASQRSSSPTTSVVSADPFPPLVTAMADGSPPPLEPSEVIPAVANEPAVSPRKLTADDAAPATVHPVRRTIDRLMPNASQEERQIWFEELRGLPVSAVEDLLRLRKESDLAAPLRSSPDPLPSITNDAADSLPTALRRYRAVLQHNLLNADTPGYRAVRVEQVALPFDVTRAFENRVSDALQATKQRIETKTGEFDLTGRPLDIAIHGPGWFVVEDEDGKPAFTRHGALRMNDQRELVLPAIPTARPLSPRVIVPEDSVYVFIDANGTINGGAELGSHSIPPWGQISLARFFDDSALVLHADGLYRPTPAAGAMTRLTADKQSSALRSGALERSNVDRVATEQSLERLERWISRDPQSTP